MRNKLLWTAAALAVAFGLMQLANPSLVNPPVQNPFPLASAPPEIAALFRASCYDCHSYETRWPWYSHIAPVSWLIASDVERGRRQLNLSDWPADAPTRAARKMEDMSDEIGYDEMPLTKYTLIHADARLTAGQRQLLENWLLAEAKKLKAQK
jgi:Haem-binding domain